MNVEQNTGKPARLSLPERAARGLLATEQELSIDDIVNLEHPGNIAGRKALRPAIRAAIDYGDLATRNEVRTSRIVRKQSGYWPVGTWLIGVGDPPQKTAVHTSTAKIEFIDREAYRQWRAQCPASLLSESSVIAAWTGEHHPVSVSEPPPESVAKGGGNPANSRQCVADKASFIKSATWQGNQTNTVNQHPQAAYFKGKYLEDSLLQWAGELDPRPKDKRGGRPRKT